MLLHEQMSSHCYFGEWFCTKLFWCFSRYITNQNAVKKKKISQLSKNMSRNTLYSISCLYMRIIMIVYSYFVNKVILPCEYILACWYIFFIYELECKTKEISNGELKLCELINGLIQIQIMVTISNLLKFIVRIPGLIQK